MIDIHTHSVQSSQIPAIYNVRINEKDVCLPQAEQLFFSAGIHPWDIEGMRTSWLENLEIMLKHKRIVAVGECGLDKNISVPLEKQLELLQHHIQLSEQYQLPLILHNVGFSHEIIRLKKLTTSSQAWIVHGFRGKSALAKQLLDAGLYLSFGEKFNAETVVITPIERLLVETDESDLSIVKIYQTIADIKACAKEDLNAYQTIFKF